MQRAIYNKSKDIQEKVAILANEQNKYKAEVYEQAINLLYTLHIAQPMELTLTDFDRYTTVTLSDACAILETTPDAFRRNVPNEMYIQYKMPDSVFRIPPEILWNIVLHLDSNGKIKEERKARVVRRMQRLFSIKALWEGMIKGNIL